MMFILLIETKWQKQSVGGTKLETILILQGGGSLGAYECGVYNALYRHDIKFNMLAGSSIGAINASIIASAQNSCRNAASILKDFWLRLAQDIQSPLFLPQLLPLPLAPFAISSDKLMAILSSMFSTICGNPNAFRPRWFEAPSSYSLADYYYHHDFFPYSWNYLYDSAPLKRTLKEYINFDSLKMNPSAGDKEESARLILTSTDVQKGEPVIFDNKRMDIDVDKIVACASYPFYGIRWDKNGDRYLWDGSLLTNTPILEVIRASPATDKEFYVVDVFPRKQEELPRNMVEVWHRARDIIFMDKTDRNLEMARDKQRYISFLKKINDIINSKEAQIDKKTQAKLKEIWPEYDELAQSHGAIIKQITRIGRVEKLHYILEDADFSLYRIKKLITEGEEDAERILNEKQGRNTQKV